MSITTWPQNERPREKLINYGAVALSDAELLAIFLRTGVRGKSAVDLARDLLNEFGSLGAVLGAKLKDFQKKQGIGPAKYSQLQAILELSKRQLKEKIQNKKIVKCAKDVRNYLKCALQSYEHEVFACLFLDARNHIITYKELFRGTVNVSAVHPREVVKVALECNATAIILAHNHPSGISTPSQSDIQITYELAAALRLVDIKVLDHLVIGKGEDTFSFAEEGIMATM